MGLFASRPEEPDEWAGIPSEPARAETIADALARTPPGESLGLGSLGLAGDTALTSVSIPVPCEPQTPLVEPEASGEPDRPHAGDAPAR